MTLWIALLACSGSGSETSSSTERRVPDASAVRVEVARLDPSGAPSMKLRLPGEVEGSMDVLVASALGGQVERVLVHKGEPIRAGQMLARIDAEIYSAYYAQAEAQRDQAKAELGRIEALGDLASASQLLQAQTTVKVADAQVRVANAQRSRSLVKAPFSGIAADVFPGRGEFLAPGSPVVRLVQLDPATISLAVADRDVVLLEAGLEVIVTTAASPVPVIGHIKYVGRAADLRTRSFPVEVEVPNADGLLLPGMIATVAVERSMPEGTLTIPQDWVVSRRVGQGVFIADEGYAKWVPIELGEILHDQVVVRTGLERGVRVITAGHRDLVDGDKLIISREGVCCTKGRTIYGAL